jgi:uncharacterized linocin/CFP29 family protein
MAELNWSDAQWQKVKDAVTEAFNKASVACAFLPLYGPLAGSTEIVRNERLVKDQAVVPGTTTIKLDADHDEVNQRLTNLTVNVLLSSEQVADETLSNALLAFRRAGNILAQEEDQIVFEGLRRGFADDDARIVANKVEPKQGLADLPTRRTFPDLAFQAGDEGKAIVSAIVTAIQQLEDRSHPAPFACVLGNYLFEKAHEPTNALALPADRITPLLKGGPLLRSGKMNDRAGIVVSLAGNAVDIVVGTPPTVQLLQRMPDAKFLFRVYERFALRIREAQPPVAGFRIPIDTLREAQRLEALAQEAAKVPNENVALATDTVTLERIRKTI